MVKTPKEAAYFSFKKVAGKLADDDSPFEHPVLGKINWLFAFRERVASVRRAEFVREARQEFDRRNVKRRTQSFQDLLRGLARQLGPEGIHIALVIVDGMVDLPSSRERMADKVDDDFMKPEDIASTMFHLASQPRSAWTFEVDLRPFKESW